MTMTAAATAYPRPGDQFYDSASYSFPAEARIAMNYSDGPNAKTQRQVREMYPAIDYLHAITTEGGTGIVATRSLVLDFENGLGTFGYNGAAAAWGEVRLAERRRAIYYCGRANLVRLAVAIGRLWTSPDVLFWIPTLDGDDWSATELADDVALHWGVVIPAGRIWANQNMDAEQLGGKVDCDRSNLFGQW